VIGAVRRGLATGLVVVAAAAGCRSRAARHHDDAGPAAAAPIDAAPVSVAWQPRTVVLDEVEVVLHEAAQDALVSRELGRQLARCLIDAERVVALARQVPPGREPSPARLEVELGARGGAPGGKVVAVLDARLVWRDGDEPSPAAAVTADATPVAGRVDTAVVALAERLREAACADLSARIRIWDAPDLVEFLDGDDPAAIHWALTLVPYRVRRPAPPALVDAIIPLLTREAPMRDAAITALVALGDPRSVPALTAIADVGDPVLLTTIVEAVTAIGGEDAHDFVQVIAAHRDPRIAEHARTALERMDRRADAGPSR